MCRRLLSLKFLKSKTGYNDVLLIPVGATNIKIREVKSSNNYLGTKKMSYHYCFPVFQGVFHCPIFVQPSETQRGIIISTAIGGLISPVKWNLPVARSTMSANRMPLSLPKLSRHWDRQPKLFTWSCSTKNPIRALNTSTASPKMSHYPPEVTATAGSTGRGVIVVPLVAEVC